MARLSDLWFRVRALLTGHRMDREFTEEMAFHLEMETKDLIRKGWSPAQARRRANIALGGVDQYREKAREARGAAPLENLIQDVRVGVRSLRKAPVFAGTVLFVLTLGIGSSAAIFSVVDGVLFRALPYPGSERIVRVFTEAPSDPGSVFAPADFLDLKAESQAFEALAGYDIASLNLVHEVGAQRLRGAVVTPEFFQVFGVDALLGRALSPAIEGPGAPPTVVLSHGFWKTTFGGDAGVVGQTLELNDRSYEVVGVMPPGFDYPGDPSLWVSSRYSVPDPPFQGDEDPSLDRGAEYVQVVGRLREGTSLGEAREEVELLWSRLKQEYPEVHENETTSVLPLREAMTESVRPTLKVLLGAVAVLLLIACGNVANLLLARGSAREMELAVRRALGASRSRLVGQLFTESLLLAGAGGVLGALLAAWATTGLLSLAPEGIPRLGEVGTDLRFVAFATALSLLVGVLTGFLPSLRMSRRDEGGGTLISGARDVGSRGRNRIRRMLVVGEVASSMVLLVGAGLMVRTLVALNRVDPGFEPQRLMAAHVSLPEPRYSDEAEIAQFVRSVEERVRTTPGVQSAGMVLSLPIRAGISGTFYFSVEGWVPEEDQEPLAGMQIATPGYFETLDIPLLKGRLFDETDGPEDPSVVVVNQAMVQRFFPDGDVLGRRVTWGDPEAEDVEWSTIVGVVGNALQGGLDREPRPEIFSPYAQDPLPFMTLVARSEAEASSLASVLRTAVAEVDPSVPLYGMATMEERLSDSLARRRFAMVLLITFGAVALALAAAGLYGVLRYSVTQRAREIGIRVAMGARPVGILRKILWEGLCLTLMGIGGGVVLTLLAARLMASLVYHVKTWDPSTVLVGGALLAVVAVAACGPPALRAARTDPLAVLKEE